MREAGTGALTQYAEVYVRLPDRGSVMTPTCKLTGFTFRREIEGGYNLK